MKKILMTVAAALLLSPLAFSQIVPVSVTGSGSYTNDASLIIDGVVPAETTWWTSSSNVWWYGTQASFVIDLGKDYQVSNLLYSVDNNDSYQVDYSLDGVHFTKLFANGIDSGAVSSGVGGMDTEASYSSPAIPVAVYEANPTMAFSPVDARYLRLEAVDGDGLYAIGEVEAFGNALTPGAVPEPSTYGLIGAAALLGIVAVRRRFRS